MRIYDDKLIIRSPGFLPYGITLEELYKPHSSTHRNKGLAEVLYDTELIERWGSGIEKIQQHCLDAGLFEPTYEEYQGFQVVFRKDVYGEEYLRSLNLNDRQIKAVMYVKENGQITNKKYQDICNTSNRTASRDLADMVASGLFEQAGITGKGTSYIINHRKGAKDAKKEALHYKDEDIPAISETLRRIDPCARAIIVLFAKTLGFSERMARNLLNNGSKMDGLKWQIHHAEQGTIFYR